MKQIKQIVEDIREELDGAEHYAKLSMKYKETEKELSEMYAELASQELVHVNRLHGKAVDLIKAAQAKGMEIPTGMQAVYDWEHERMIERKAKIKTILDMYQK